MGSAHAEPHFAGKRSGFTVGTIAQMGEPFRRTFVVVHLRRGGVYAGRAVLGKTAVIGCKVKENKGDFPRICDGTAEMRFLRAGRSLCISLTPRKLWADAAGSAGGGAAGGVPGSPWGAERHAGKVRGDR